MVYGLIGNRNLLLYSRTNRIVSVYADVARKGQVYFYIGENANNCMAINIDPSGVNFRSRINGSEERMWTIHP